MHDATLRRIGWAMAGAAVLFAVVATVVYVVEGELGLFVDDWIVHNVVGTVLFATVGLLGLRSQQRNLAVWAYVWIALFGSMQALGAAAGLAVSGFSNSEIQAGIPLSPSELEPLAAAGFTLAAAAWAPVVFGLSTFALLVFPGGLLRDRVDRWMATLSLGLIGVVTALFAWTTRPWSETTYSVIAESGMTVVGPLLGVLVVLGLLTLARLVVRARRAEGEIRLQYRWGLWGLGGFVLVQPTLLIDSRAFQLVSIVAIGNLAVSLGVAVLRYRLYQIDAIINRTFVFVGLAGLILAVYAPVVVGIGDAVGGSGLWLPIASTVVVAIVFEPARLRLQKWANRLVYGRRATPYEVLSDLTGRLAGAEREEGLFERMAVRLGQGTGAERAAVWVADDDGGLRAAAATPVGEAPAAVASLEELPGVVAPIRRDGELLGALTVQKRRGDAMTPTEADLVAGLAGSAGLVMRRLRLDAALAEKAEQLQRSRLRLVTAQDVERRRLERDLHDGAQQQLVAIKVKLALARQVAEREGSQRTAELVAGLADEAQAAIDQVRSLAQGIYPPLLESEGLTAAIPNLAGVSSLDVRVAVDVEGRHPIALEGAVYFCVSEALTNAAKHARGPVSVEVSDRAGGLAFSVTDAGPGFDPETSVRGAGLDNMADRLDALGGTLSVTSRPGGPTTVEGCVPVPSVAGA